MKLGLNFTIGVGILAVVIFAAVLGTFWTPHDPNQMQFAARLRPPGATALLGTDEFGRDVLSRLMVGARMSLMIASLAVIISLCLGTLIGVAGGFWRGPVDRVLMTFNDALLAFPGILLALGLLAILGASPFGLVVALGLAFSPAVARVVRGSVLSVREREYVDASRVIGNSNLYTLLRHVLPNCTAPLYVLATSMLGWAILSESALSFLGLGVAPPAATWGNMLSASRTYLSQAPWLGIFPGLAITLTLLGINLFADSMRDAFDPRMRVRA